MFPTFQTHRAAFSLQNKNFMVKYALVKRGVGEDDRY